MVVIVTKGVGACQVGNPTPPPRCLVLLPSCSLGVKVQRVAECSMIEKEFECWMTPTGETEVRQCLPPQMKI